jgi:hypothetical protein
VPRPRSPEEYVTICGYSADPTYSQFLIDISTIASMVTDYHLGPPANYTSESVQILDGQLEALEAGLPLRLRWAHESPGISTTDSLRRHLVLLRLRSVRAYLHRPFLLAQSSPLLENRCIEACIEVINILLGLYAKMRPNQRLLFFLSFYFFDASVILLIAIYRKPFRTDRLAIMEHAQSALEYLNSLKKISNVALRGSIILQQLIANCPEAPAHTAKQPLNVTNSQILSPSPSNILLEDNFADMLGTSLADWIDPTNPQEWQFYLDAIVKQKSLA